MTVENSYSNVLGVITFPAGGLEAWLGDEIYPATDLEDIAGHYYDLAEYRPEPAQAALDAAKQRGLAVKIDGERVFLHGNPGDARFAADAIPLMAAVRKAADHRGLGVVMFLGADYTEQADFAAALSQAAGGGKQSGETSQFDFRFFRRGRKPPRLPLAAGRLAATLGEVFGKKAGAAARQTLTDLGYDARAS